MHIKPLILNVTINGSSSEPFTLQYNSSESTSLTASSSASQFDSAVTAIIDGASGSDIVVTKSVVDDQTRFQVVFFEAIQRNNTLEVGQYNSSNVDVVITIIQYSRYPTELIFALESRQTDTISILDSDHNLDENTLYDIISVTCTKSPAGQVYWSHSYDGTTGTIWGTLDNSVDPQCGRYSLKDPFIVFRASNSRDDSTGVAVPSVPVLIYQWVST